jgi:hypothetical protein
VNVIVKGDAKMKELYSMLMISLLTASHALAQISSPVPQAGEISMVGAVSKIDQGGKSFVVQAAGYTTVGGAKAVVFGTPKAKTITIEPTTKWAKTRGFTLTPSEITGLSDAPPPDFKTGSVVVVVGKDLGTGKPLPARLISITIKEVGDTQQGSAQESAASQSATEHIKVGWPQQIKGRITGAPAAADLDGDGKLEVVVPVIGNDGAAQLFAYHHDGKVVRNWPVVFFTAQQMNERKKARNYLVWFSSPSVMDLDRDGTDEIVIPLPEGEPRGVRILFGGGEPWPWPINAPADPWVSVPLVDLNNDRVIDLVLGQVHTSVQNKPIPGWPETRMLHGYAPCVGDADGDGDLEVYQPDYQNHWHLPDQPPANSVSGYDHQGNALSGWPQKISGIAIYPVMGDVWGDDKMEVCAVDSAGQMHLWTHDGQALPSTRATGEFSSVFKTGSRYANEPTLADLDGDGKAEIIVYDSSIGSIRAWRGDGSSVVPPSATKADGAPQAVSDGILARLPGYDGRVHVTVADLGGDDEMDLFVGRYWVRWKAGTAARVTEMAPRTVLATTTAISDLDRDGLADVVFGTSEGQLYVFETGKGYKPEWMQWVTTRGNFRHTGAWHSPLKRRP